MESAVGNGRGRVTGPGTRVQFRVDAPTISRLRAVQRPGESLSDAARRLMLAGLDAGPMEERLGRLLARLEQRLAGASEPLSAGAGRAPRDPETAAVGGVGTPEARPAGLAIQFAHSLAAFGARSGRGG